MNVTLEEALQNVPLEPGKTYYCEVRGRTVEVRVLTTLPEPSAIHETDILLEPWVELPRPPATGTARAKPGPMPLPDPPVIS